MGNQAWAAREPHTCRDTGFTLALICSHMNNCGGAGAEALQEQKRTKTPSLPAITCDHAKHKPKMEQNQALFTLTFRQAGQFLLSSCALTCIAWAHEVVPKQ